MASSSYSQFPGSKPAPGQASLRVVPKKQLAPEISAPEFGQMEKGVAVYDQSDGRLVMPDGTVFHGGSGKLDSNGRFQPATEWRSGYGPIPKGLYGVEAPAPALFKLIVGKDYSMALKLNPVDVPPLRDSHGKLVAPLHDAKGRVLKDAKGTPLARDKFLLHHTHEGTRLASIGCQVFKDKDTQIILAAHATGAFDRIRVVGKLGAYTPAPDAVPVDVNKRISTTPSARPVIVTVRGDVASAKQPGNTGAKVTKVSEKKPAEKREGAPGDAVPLPPERPKDIEKRFAKKSSVKKPVQKSASPDTVAARAAAKKKALLKSKRAKAMRVKTVHAKPPHKKPGSHKPTHVKPPSRKPAIRIAPDNRF